MAKKVTTIPATLNQFNSVPIVQKVLKRVCGYARVSTDLEEQASSYDAQLDYYTSYIKAHSGWTFVGMYADEGISGTSTKRREGFNEMVEDALAGKVDLIITKSVSRFARNTVDSLQTVRKLKEKGVEIYFEKENIWTFDSKGELLITIMSSLAQEESRSISENTTWGKRKSFQDGKVSIGFKNFLGYDKGPNGEFVINEEQAKTVRMIYHLFLLGYSQSNIAKKLYELGMKTPTGNDKWHVSSITSILKNEKYKGDALLQKEYTVDFLTKKKKKNKGEVAQYYVEGHHQGIVTKDEFDRVQVEISRRKVKGYSSASIFSSKLKCGDCGNFYGPVVQHSNDQYRKIVYRCTHKYLDGDKCKTPNMKEEQIKEIFVKAVNVVISEKKEMIANAKLMMGIACNPDRLEEEKNQVIEQMNEVIDEMQVLAEKGESSEYAAKKYDELSDEYAKYKKRFDDLLEEMDSVGIKEKQFKAYIDSLEQTGDPIEEFDEVLWSQLLDFITVNSKEDITVTFRDGTEIRVK